MCVRGGGGCVKPGVGVGGLLLWQGVGYAEMESRVPVSWRRLWSNWGNWDSFFVLAGLMSM